MHIAETARRLPQPRALLRDFGAMLTNAEHKFRADKLLYADHSVAALRAATLAGPAGNPSFWIGAAIGPEKRGSAR